MSNRILSVERVTVSGDGLSLDLILWRKYRRRMPGLLEMALDLNPGLAGKGPTLPIGTVIDIPIVDPDPARDLQVVQLWD